MQRNPFSGREAWIAARETGRNPFAEETLEVLRNEQVATCPYGLVAVYYPNRPDLGEE
jgi:hypothetical protein